MAVTLNANTSTGFIATSDTSGVLQLQTGGTTAVSIGTDQSFNFSATGQRITGDFSNATVANRVMFQNSVTNGNTVLGAIPNGTGAASALIFNSSNDPANSSTLITRVGSDTGVAAILSAQTGTGTYLPMTFNTGGSESLRLSATTKAVILAGGSTSANGTGITFPATQSASSDANTLDDYEEGTWTPVIYFGASVGYSAYSQQNGTYTKIGNVVTVRSYIYGSTKSAATGTAQLYGLPFPLKNSATYQAVAIGYVATMSSLTGGVMAYGGQGSNAVVFGQTSATGFAALTNSNFNNATDLMFQWTYLTD